MEEEHDTFIEKLFEIPTVKIASSLVSNIYNNVKSSNKTIGGVLETAEVGVAVAVITIQPVTQKFSGPIGVVDALGCRILDTMKEKLPFINESPEKVLSSANQLVTNNAVTQAGLYGVDTLLSLSEKTLTLIPSVAEVEPEEKENASLLGHAFLSVKQLYSTVTTPVRTVEHFVHEQRKKIRKWRRKAKYQNLPPEVIEKINQRRKVSPKKRIQRPGFLGRLLAIPRKAIAFIGIIAHERTILKLSEDPSIIQSPTTPGLKRCFDSITSSGDLDLSALNNLEDYNSEEDPDYKTEESMGSGESSEDSGSFDENEIADLIKDVEENPINSDKQDKKEITAEKGPVSEVSTPKSPKKSLSPVKQSQNPKDKDQKPQVEQPKAQNTVPANQKKSEAKLIGKSGDKDHPLANSTEAGELKLMALPMVQHADKQTQTYSEDDSWQLVKFKSEACDQSIQKTVLSCLSQTAKAKHVTISTNFLLIFVMFVIFFLILFHL